MAGDLSPRLTLEARRLLSRRRWLLWGRITLLAGLVCVVVAARWRASPGDAERFHQRWFRVLSVPTADTVRILVDGEPLDVHLLGVDAADEAEDSGRWEESVGSKVLLYLESVPTRKAGGQLLAYVFLEDGTLLNAKRVSAGHAFVDRRYEFTYRRTFEQAEEAAIGGGLGMWSVLEEGGEPAMPAWRARWRAEMKRPPWDRRAWLRSDEP